MSTERWLPVPEYEGRYEVSSRGGVRALARVVTRIDGVQMRLPAHVMDGYIDGNGYRSVRLTDASGLARHRRIHRLVLAAFVGPCPPGMFGCHNDGDPLNSDLSNLRWDTPASNTFDAVRHGVHFMAAKTHGKHGHEFTEANIYRTKTGRNCRTCKAARARERSEKRRECAA